MESKLDELSSYLKKYNAKITDFLLEKGTDEDATEYFINLLSVFKATRPAAEMTKPYTLKSKEIDEYCHRYGRHSLELSVIEDFLKMDILCLKVQTESENSSSITNSFNYDPFYGWFIDLLHTSERKFYTSPEDSHDVEFMCFTGYKHNYSENELFRMVEIEIKTFTSLYVFLPREHFKLNEIMKNMKDTEQFHKLKSSSKKTYINIAIPNFKISSELNLETFVESIEIDQRLTNLVTKNCFETIKENVSCTHKAHFEFTDRKYEEEDEDYYGYPKVGRPYDISLEAVMSRISEEYKMKEFVADHSFVFVLEKDSHYLAIIARFSAHMSNGSDEGRSRSNTRGTSVESYIWTLILTVIAESEALKEEMSYAHQLSRTVAHMSRKSRYDSQVCLNTCEDGEYCIKWILSILKSYGTDAESSGHEKVG
ncbi:hypothetical protein L5515_012277 [Caenorhabditis briggsae]|uniref:Serpin domain-containing protein n=1 Tax=Caenorhabditis briggsae TaxID=6238 RepID=A0AAE9EXS5_CAEBR|nr:hypothetical protein L5515_012277 [Caenorhabditis briggsae]